MTREKYEQLTENLVDEFCRQWPDSSIRIPSYEQANKQEKDRLLLENKNKGTEKMKIEDINKKFDDVFNGPSRREKLDEKLYYEEVEEQERLEEETKNFTLSESQQKLADEISGKKPERDHSLDSAFAEAFGSSEKNARLEELKESFGNESEGSELLETVHIDLMDSGANGVFKFSGRAFQTDVINSNGRRYSRAITEGALRENRGGTLSIISGHPHPSDTDPSKVVGKVIFSDTLDSAGWVLFEGSLSNTSLGKDLQILLQDKTISDVSLRSRGLTKQVKSGNEMIEEVITLKFKGLDLVREGSFTGAKVDRIFS